MPGESFCCSLSTRGTKTPVGSKSGSSRPVAPPKREGSYMRKVSRSIRKELMALANRPDSEIDYSDIPASTRKDWAGAVRGKFYRPIKQQLTVRIDADVVAWLKSYGKGYQSRLNAILRSVMLGKTRRRRAG